MDLTAISRWRLYNLRLAGEPERSPESALRRLFAAQAQEFGRGKWSIAQRTAGAGNAELDRLYNDGRILRTHVLRPTWHFLHRDDIHLALQVTGPRIRSKLRPRYRRLELDESLLARSTDLIGNALRGGNHLTRREIGALLQDAGVNVEGQRLPHILMCAELDGVICSGVMSGNQHAYALLDERAPGGTMVDPDEALATLTLRYLASHGPATVKDLSAWSSLKITDVRRGIAMNQERLESLELDGLTYWYSGDPPANTDATSSAHLLNRYDELMMGYLESRHAIDGAGRLDTLHPDNLNAYGPLTIDGQIAGLWRSTASSTPVQVEIALKRSLSDAETEAIRREIDRYGAFLGTGASVELS